MFDRIEIIAYDPRWEAEFDSVAKTIQRALQPVPHRVHHIGSTAVPGLGAKDIIDVMVSVRSLDEPTLRPLFEALGWTWRADVDHDHMPPGSSLPADDLAKLYSQANVGRRVNCHIRVPGAFNHRYALLFRDYLRAHPGPRVAYEEIKRQLAARFPNDPEAYYDIKDPVTDLIMAGALAWASTTDWQEPDLSEPRGT